MKYCSHSVSRKIAVLSTNAIVAVVIIHCNSLEDVRDPAWAFLLGRSIAYLQLWAVPFFFMVSGFFFDRAFDDKPLFANWLSFLRKKMKSLAVPYVLWGSLFGLITMTPLKMYVNKLHGDPILTGTVFAATSIWEAINWSVGITSGNFVGALWYVRLLLIFFITAPVWVCLRKLSRWLPLLVGLALVLGFSSVSGGGADLNGEHIGCFCIRVGGIGWILLGMAVSAFRVEDVRLPKMLVALSGLLWLVLSAIVIQNRLIDAPWSPFLREWFRIAPFFLILVWWGGYDYVPQILPENLPKWFCWRFWVYCMHHPMTGWCGGIVYAVVGHGICGRCICQAVLAPFVLFVCLVAACATKRLAPRLFAVLCGGR